LRARIGLPISKVESVAQSGFRTPDVGRYYRLIHVEGPPKRSWEECSVYVSPAVSAARLASGRAGGSVVNTLKVNQGHERLLFSG
jgi:hypothetical protein